ncbi:MAG: TrkH family potassium uptake protein [Leptospirillia bacterium]
MGQPGGLRPFTRLRNYQAGPAQLLIGGASSIILLGTILLVLPQASASGHSIGLVDALFTSVSAVCVTGLIVLDTPNDFTTFGHVVLLFLFQVGGLGYMTSATFVAVVLGKRMGLRNRLVLKEAMASPTMEGLARLAVLTVKVTLVVEVLTALFLTLHFIGVMPVGRALWFGLFHSVSAFNNAGFALFTDSLSVFQGDPLATVPLAFTIILGATGILVISDLSHRLRGDVSRLSLHTRLTLSMMLVVGGVGAACIFFLERGAGASMEGAGALDGIGVALFQSFASRTAGFATMDVSLMAPATLFLLILLMLIGGASGSAAGGIKVSTCGVILASLWSTLRGREQVNLFHRTVPHSIIQKSFFLAFAALFLLVGATWVVLALEGTRFMPTIFEVASAVGTVGLSVGDGTGRSFCAQFGDSGKLLIALCMFIGRLGPLTIGIAVLRSDYQKRYRLPEEKVLIG